MKYRIAVVSSIKQDEFLAECETLTHLGYLVDYACKYGLVEITKFKDLTPTETSSLRTLNVDDAISNMEEFF